MIYQTHTNPDIHINTLLDANCLHVLHNSEISSVTLGWGQRGLRSERLKHQRAV